MPIILKVTEGPHKDREFAFSGHDTFLVGRSKHAHFQLPNHDKYFSRIHFMIEVNPPRCRLVDMGSRNGTFVNGQKVPMADLKNGDRVQAGKTTMQVSIDDDDAIQPTVTEFPASPDVPAATSTENWAPGADPEVELEAPPVFDALQGLMEGSALQSAPAEPVQAQCRVCAADFRGVVLTWPICSACSEKIHKHPQTIPGYHVVQELGRGGMGVVYLGLRDSDGTLVALKTITPTVEGSKDQVARFLREANILRQLDHPNIVRFRESGQAGRQLYFAMEYVVGTDASRLLKKHGPLSVGRAVTLMCQLLEALGYAHANRFVHRDIKPANILVARMPHRAAPSTTGRSYRSAIHVGKDVDVVKLADFGLARVYQTSELSGLSVLGGTAGTVGFMAPEQITNFREAEPPVDQYAAASTLYNLLTDKYSHPVKGNVAEQLGIILQGKPIPIRTRRADIPEGLAEIIHKAMAREPNDRFAEVGEMRKALLPFRQ